MLEHIFITEAVIANGSSRVQLVQMAMPERVLYVVHSILAVPEIADAAFGFAFSHDLDLTASSFSGVNSMMRANAVWTAARMAGSPIQLVFDPPIQLAGSQSLLIRNDSGGSRDLEMWIYYTRERTSLEEWIRIRRVTSMGG